MDGMHLGCWNFGSPREPQKKSSHFLKRSDFESISGCFADDTPIASVKCPRGTKCLVRLPERGERVASSAAIRSAAAGSRPR